MFFKGFLLVLEKYLFWRGDWALGYHSREFRDLTRESTRIYHVLFISNSRTSFHLWWRENLVKHQKIPKYYVNDCRTPATPKMEFLVTSVRSSRPEVSCKKGVLRNFPKKACNFVKKETLAKVFSC